MGGGMKGDRASLELAEPPSKRRLLARVCGECIESVGEFDVRACGNRIPRKTLAGSGSKRRCSSRGGESRPLFVVPWNWQSSIEPFTAWKGTSPEPRRLPRLPCAPGVRQRGSHRSAE